jgi:hypothetical protein
VPAGFVGHLPVGVSFIGGRWDEPNLIGLAYAFEQATHVRVPPAFLATTSSAAAASGAARTQVTQPARPESVGSRKRILLMTQ